METLTRASTPTALLLLRRLTERAPLPLRCGTDGTPHLTTATLTRAHLAADASPAPPTLHARAHATVCDHVPRLRLLIGGEDSDRVALIRLRLIAHLVHVGTHALA